MKNKFKLLFFGGLFVYFSLPNNVKPNDNHDLDDIKLYDIVRVEQCLDQAYDTVPGHARKLEFKIEGDDILKSKYILMIQIRT